MPSRDKLTSCLITFRKRIAVLRFEEVRTVLRQLGFCLAKISCRLSANGFWRAPELHVHTQSTAGFRISAKAPGRICQMGALLAEEQNNYIVFYLIYLIELKINEYSVEYMRRNESRYSIDRCGGGDKSECLAFASDLHTA
jgi:hypothetical protein